MRCQEGYKKRRGWGSLRRLLFTFIGILLCVGTRAVTADAAQNYVVSTDWEAVEALSDTQYVIPLYISGNKGIMGFRLYLDYNAEALRIDSITKGLVTDGGTFGSDLSLESAYSTSVLWNATENVDRDGSLMYITVTLLAADLKTIEIGVNYSQEDTFDGDYKDVKLDCKAIDIELKGESSGQAENKELHSLIENSEEEKYMNLAKEEGDGLHEIGEIGTERMKLAVIHTMQDYGIKSLADVPEGREEEFWKKVEGELTADGSIGKKQLKKFDIEKAAERLVISEDDFYSVQFGYVEPAQKKEEKKEWIWLGVIILTVIVLAAGWMLIRGRRRQYAR